MTLGEKIELLDLLARGENVAFVSHHYSVNQSCLMTSVNIGHLRRDLLSREWLNGF